MQKMTQYLRLKRSKGNVKIELNLSNYATKTNLKEATRNKC